MAYDHHITEPVPIYLIPPAIAEEIRKYGDSIAEFRIRRTRGHSFVIKTRFEVRGERHE
jgi:hypothetical protein